MTHRVPPPAELLRYVQSVSSPPAPLAGDLVPPSEPAPQTPLPPTVAPALVRVARVPAARLSMRGRRRRSTVVILVIIILVSGVVLVALFVSAAPSDESSRSPREGIHAGAPSSVLRAPPHPLQPRCPRGSGCSFLWFGLLFGTVLVRETSPARDEKKPRPDPDPTPDPTPERPSELASVVDQPPPTKPLTPARRLGAASITGNVRETNQDRVRVGSVGEVPFLIVADGLGGLPRGAEAAEEVSTYAHARLTEDLPQALAGSMEGVRTLLLGVVWGAATHLTCTAHARGWVGPEAGFRTTLILVVALKDCYLSAWMGDGIVGVVRDETIVALLEPHKSPETPNVLDASLGPTTDGRPSWAIAPRLGGDLLVVATDGVGDVFDEALATSVRACLSACEGDAEETAKTIVENLAEARDELGYIVTDNLTLALLTTDETS